MVFCFVFFYFSEAIEFDSDIDPFVIGNATSWILKQQNENGSFNESGLVYMKRLQVETSLSPSQCQFIATSVYRHVMSQQ